MTRLVQQFKALLYRLVKAPRARVLARLRAHIALAVNDDLRSVTGHVTAERVALSAELRERIAAELTPIRQQLDDLHLCNDGMLREVVRLQREVQQLLAALERLSPERSSAEIPPVSNSLTDAPRLKLIDEHQVRAA